MMESMYDVIMQLPLFKGFTTDQVSDGLKKLELDFATYSEDDIIIGRGSMLDRLGLVVSGEIELHTIMPERIVIKQTLGKGFWILPDCLFGYSTQSPVDVVCEHRAGILWISKSRLAELVASNDFCRINYLNYLCYSSQSRRSIAGYVLKGNMFERWLAVTLLSHTERRAKSIEIEVPLHRLALFLDVGERMLATQMRPMIRRKKIAYANDVIHVFNRRDYF